MLMRSVWRRRTIALNISDWRGSSTGIRGIVDSHLLAFNKMIPKAEVATKLVRCQNLPSKAISDSCFIEVPKGVNIFGSRNIRMFHASPNVLVRKNDLDAAEKYPKKQKRVKKETRKPPVVAPYVPPQRKNLRAKSSNKIVDIFEGMTLGELAKRTGASVSTLQGIVTNVGEKVDSEFDPINMDIAELVAMEVGVNVQRLHSEEGLTKHPRPPVVTVMGHVDHGKTSLLDALRQTSLAAKEAGGITQHIGAFVVSMPSGASITFLDTPGHAAFSAMRARGAAITDIVVLVVAADDGVMPQTLEAISHARSANVPIVVAINKCDKPSAEPERVRIQLGSEGLMLEDMGGDVQVVEVSATSKVGLDKLEEALSLQAELMDLKSRTDGLAQAYVVEAKVDRGRGPVATAIVKAGTLVSGKYIVVGSEWGKIRALRDMGGKVIESAGPATPVVIEGLKGLPKAGDDVVVVDSEERAKMLSNGRKMKLERDRLLNVVEDKYEVTNDSEEVCERVELPIIVKADVQGTVQAVTDALRSLNSEQVFVNIVHVGVGPITQSDVDLAQACGACIVGFNIRSPPAAVARAASPASIPKGRSLSPSKIVAPRPERPHQTRQVINTQYDNATIDAYTNKFSRQSISPASSTTSISEDDSYLDSDDDSDVPSLTSRSTNSSSPSSVSSRSSCCTCERYGITRAGERVKLDCGGARCGYSDDSSECSSEDEYAYEAKTTRRQGVVIRT